MGVVGHGREFWCSLQENQLQADVLCIFKKLLTIAPVRVMMHHIYAHQNRNLCFDQLNNMEQANVLADNLAAEDLLSSVTTGRFISVTLPFKDVRLKVEKRGVSGPLTNAIYNFWWVRVARAFLHDKGIVHRRDFNLVYWDGVEAAM